MLVFFFLDVYTWRIFSFLPTGQSVHDKQNTIMNYAST